MFGLPQMGVNGAALATLIARVVELIWAIVSSYQKGFLRPRFTYLFQRDKQLSADFRRFAFATSGLIASVSGRVSGET